jgi:hypothetical protein
MTSSGIDPAGMMGLSASTNGEITRKFDLDQD